MDKLVSDFKSAQAGFINALEKFPVEKVDETLFGDWNLKDVVAHFVGWDKEFTSALKSFRKGIQYTYWGKIYEFKEKVVSASKNKSWQEILAEFKKSGDDFIAGYAGYPENLLSHKIWKDKIYTPARIMEINIHHYRKAQFVKINALLKKWGLL